MQRFLIKCVNFALLIVIVIGIPAVTRAQLWKLQIASAPALQLLLFWSLSLALAGNISAAAFLIRSRKERILVLGMGGGFWSPAVRLFRLRARLSPFRLAETIFVEAVKSAPNFELENGIVISC